MNAQPIPRRLVTVAALAAGAGAALAAAFPLTARAATLQVGPGDTYANPSDAAAAAVDGDVIDIAAGDYHGDVATWTASHLTIRGVGGMAHLFADGQNAGGKAIWVIQGDDTTVENIEFSGETVPDGNGAGIRQEGAGLTVRHCYFHDNQDGILAGANANSDIVIEYSEFNHNGAGDGFTHNMYINQVKSFTLRYSWSHRAHVGHEVKSRALTNYIIANRISDESDGDSSYLLDLPDAGRSYVIGNVFEQGPNAQNHTLLCYGCEQARNADHALYVVNNTFVNDVGAGTFIHNATATTAVLANNLFVGGGQVASGPVMETSDLPTNMPGFVDRAGYDYHLTAGSPALDAGSDPGMAGGMSLLPTVEYVHPAGGESRMIVGSAIDIGAFELGNMPGADGGMSSPGDGGMPGPAADGGGIGASGDGGGAAAPSSGGCGCRVGARTGRGGAGGAAAVICACLLAIFAGGAPRPPDRRRRQPAEEAPPPTMVGTPGWARSSSYLRADGVRCGNPVSWTDSQPGDVLARPLQLPARMQRTVPLLLALSLAACTAGPAPAIHDSGPVGRSADAAAAAAGVPSDLLLAVAVEEGGLQLPAIRVIDPDDNVPVAGIVELRHGRLDTLAMGARLIGKTEDDLRVDTALGTRAGALVLAALGQKYGAGADLASWRPALEALSGMDDVDAHNYASGVLDILRKGGTFKARGGEMIRIAPHPSIATWATHEEVRASSQTPDFPGAIWFPTSCTNKCTVGRPLGKSSVNKIVIHDTEGGWSASVATLQYDSGKSVHYIVSANGKKVGQFRHEIDTTWHAGNYYYNETSVGIEHVGYASSTSGYSDGLYQTSVKLVKSIRSRWSVPLDRKHIVGHYQIPNGNKIPEDSAPCTDTLENCENSANYGGASNHRDPGFHWQWCQYMQMLGGHCTCNDAWPLWNCTTDGTEAVRCTNGKVQIDSCPGGCDVMPIGQNDVCHTEVVTPPDGGSAGSDAGSSAGPDAGTTVGPDAGSPPPPLVDAGGQPAQPSQHLDVSGGCAIAAAGHGAGGTGAAVILAAAALAFALATRRRRG